MTASRTGFPRRPIRAIREALHRLYRLRRCPIWSLRLWCRAVAATPGTSIEVLLGLLSLHLTLFFPGPDADVVGVLAAIVGVLLLAFVISAELALQMLRPEEYALVVVSGRSPSATFAVLARHVQRVLEDLIRVVTPARECLADIALAGAQIRDITERAQRGDKPEAVLKERGTVVQLFKQAFADKVNARAVSVLVRKLKRLRNAQDVPVRRITALKHLAARELEIPIRALCDHVLQFGPSLYWDRLSKFIRNWEMMKSRAARLDSDMVGIFGGMALQNDRIFGDAQERCKAQKMLIRRRDLHEAIHLLASEHSTSGSVLTYATALANLAAREHTDLDGSMDRCAPLLLDRVYGGFRFLLRKQRAHSGCSLHVLLKGLCSGLGKKKRLVVESEALARIVDALECMDGDELRQSETGHLYPKDFVPSHADLKETLRALAEDLPRFVLCALESSRTGILREFRQVHAAYLHEAPGKVVLVTHGYSKTVRELVRNGPVEGHHVFLLVPDDRDDSHVHDTRVLGYELKIEADLKRQLSIAMGSQDVLLGLLGPGDRVLLLLGAECFDAEGRVVHPRGLLGVLGGLVPSVRARGAFCAVVAVAEGYKRLDSLLARSQFYRDHFDRVAVYPPGSVHAIVSDDDIHPRGSWSSALTACLRTEEHSMSQPSAPQKAADTGSTAISPRGSNSGQRPAAGS